MESVVSDSVSVADINEIGTTETKKPKSKKDKDLAVEALNHLVQGKRHLLVRDVPSAVESLANSCRLLDACYGQLADECGDAYYNYGVALLELSRCDNSVLVNAAANDYDNGRDGESGSVNDNDNDNDDEENDRNDKDNDDDEDDDGDGSENDDDSKTDDASKVIHENGVDKREVKVKVEVDPKLINKDSEAKSENLEESEAADERKQQVDVTKVEIPSTNDEVKSSVSLSSIEVPTVNPSTTNSSVNDKPGTSSSGSSDSKENITAFEAEEEPSSLQLAWEVFEVAKIIFKRQTKDNPEMMLNLARVHARLGEVSMESENYQESINDLLICLGLQTSLLSFDDRLIAETYYQLGLAHSFALQFDLSIDSFKNAIQTLKDRISILEKIATNVNEDNSMKEIDELKLLIVDINEKIIDTDDLRKNSVKLPEALVETDRKSSLVESSESATATFQVTEKPVCDIGHLVRKKRKPEDSEVSTSDLNVDMKRGRCQLTGSENENASNGHVAESDI